MRFSAINTTQSTDNLRGLQSAQFYGVVGLSETKQLHNYTEDRSPAVIRLSHLSVCKHVRTSLTALSAPSSEGTISTINFKMIFGEYFNQTQELLFIQFILYGTGVNITNQ
jgi:hypothetical protein